MEFIDHTGHIFSLPDYSKFPVGYEYSENPYVFWLSDCYSSQLSIDCFYIKPIYILTGEPLISKITIECNKTNNYRLLSSTIVQEKLRATGMFNDNEIDWTKANFELDFFTDDAKQLLNNKCCGDGVITDNFTQSLTLTNNDIIDGIESELFYFTGIDGKDYDVLNEQLIYDGKCEGILSDTQLFEINEFKESFNSVDKVVYINENNIPVSKDEFKELISEQCSFYINNFVTNNKNEDISGSIEDINAYISKYQQSHIRTVYSKKTKYKMIPFYVLGNVKEPGVWMTNILITLFCGNKNIYCPITVGGTYVDEQEALIINGKNMGVDLPKDICRAMYNISFWNETPNLSLWNQKIKEYLLNYMKLKGERGNFQSAIHALKWFGYGDKLSLSTLIQTDNTVINQYICDNFDLNFDVINEFRYFRYSTLLSLSIPGVIEDPSGATNDFTWNNDFWGEGKPKLHDRFNEYIEPKHYDEGDIDFVRPYYDWTFNEIGLKLCALKYYYKKYFLPIHLSIHRASITNQCFANDIKILHVTSNLITEQSIYARDNNFNIKFNDSNVVWMEDMSDYNIYVDPDTWIFDSHLSEKINDYTDIYYVINDNCFCVDIHFINKTFKTDSEHIYYCKMLTYQNDNVIITSDFTLYSTEEDYCIKFIIYPKFINKDFDINFWLDKDYTIKLMVNGIWFEYKFNLKIPELDIELGKLEYCYDYNTAKQFIGFNGTAPIFNANMYLPDMVSINNISFTDELIRHIEDENLEMVGRQLINNEQYYYTIKCDKDSKKYQRIILSSGQNTLIEHDNKYYITPNPYYQDISKCKTNESFEFVTKLPEKNDDNKIYIIESKTPIYSSMCRNITTLIDLYSIHSNIPDNKHLMNKVHIFKLLEKNGTEYNQIEYITDNNLSGKINKDIDNNKFIEYKYDYESNNDRLNDLKSEFMKIQYDTATFSDNDSEYVKNLYSNFFDNNGDWTVDLEYFDDKTHEWKSETNIQQHFDLFLMHDVSSKTFKGYWYVIMISKNTIGDSDVDLDNIIDKSRLYRSCSTNNAVYIQCERSDEKILVNRMNFSKMNGVYHFKSNETIVARLNNFNNIPHKLKIGSRWTFTPLAIGTEFKNYYDSPTNIGLMSIGTGTNKAERGYYKVEVKYSVDNFVNEICKRSTKFLIDDSLFV